MADVLSLILGINAGPAKQGAKEAEQAFDRVEKKSRQAQRQLEGFDKSLDKAGGSAKKTGSASRGAAGSVDKLGTSAGRASKNADRLAASTRRAGSAARAASIPLGRLVSAYAALAALRSATTAIRDFERTMVTFRGVTNSGADAMARASEVARQLGATTRFSASEAAEGLVFLARAGLGVENSLAALPATLNLAASSGMELGAAADLASNVLSQFGLNASETVRVVDALVRVSNQANTDVPQLGEAMKFAGSIAGQMGRSVEETAVSLGLLGDRGIQASLAGTNLRGVMLALASPSSEARDLIEELGLNMEKLNPETNRLADVFRELARAQLTAGQAGLIFGRRNAGAALILANNAEAISRNVKLLETMNSAQKLASEATNTLDGSLKNLRSAVEALFLSAGDSGLSGALRFTVDLMTDVIRAAAGVEGRVLTSTHAVESMTRAIKLMIGAWLAMRAVAVVSMLANITQAIWGMVAATRALKIAIAATGIGALIVGVGLAASEYLRWRDSIRATRRELELIKDARRLDAVTDLESVRQAAEAAGNSAVALRAIQEQVSILDRAIDDVMNKDRVLKPVEMQILIGKHTDPENAARLVAQHSKTGTSLGPTADELRAFQNGTLSVAKTIELFSERTRKSGLETTTKAEKLAILTARMGQLKDAMKRLQKVEEESRPSVAGVQGPRIPAGFQYQGQPIPDAIATTGELQTVPIPPSVSGPMKAHDDAKRSLQDLIRLQEQQSELLQVEITKGREAAEVAAARFEVERLAREGNISDASAAIAAVEAQILKQQALMRILEERAEAERRAEAAARRNGEIAVRTFDTITRTMQAGRQEGEKWIDVFKRMGRQLSDLALEVLVFDQIRTGLRGAFGAVNSGGGGGLSDPSNFPNTFGEPSAKGNIMSYQSGLPQIERFAMGGIPDIVGREYAFPMAGGRVGTLGENVRPDAKEGIVPLYRTPSGELGVKSQGGGGTVNHNNQQTINQTFHIHTPDAGGMKRSEPQIRRMMRDSVRS